MADAYGYKFAEIDASVSKLNNIISKYEDSLTKLVAKRAEIASSSEWEDADLKTEFLNKLDQYIIGFTNSKMAMKCFVKYVPGKSQAASAIEEKFSA